ncbi:MAG: hypothetical protein AAB383_05445 [Patescibacteria group bacterium]
MSENLKDFDKENASILAEIFSRELGLVSKETKDSVHKATCELARDSSALDSEYGNEWIRHLGIDWDNEKGKQVRKERDKLPPALQYLIEKIEGGVLIDLSSGPISTGTKSIGESARARILIGVDLFRYLGENRNTWTEDRQSELFKPLRYNGHEQFYPRREGDGRRVIHVKADNLEALSRIPDGSPVHIGVNGFDTWVLRSSRYHHQLAVEINRALGVGSMVFGVNSEVLTVLKKDKFQANFREIDFPEKERAPFDEQAYILEKIS